MTDEIFTISREFYLNNKPRIKIHNERLYLDRVYQQQRSLQNISFCSKLQCANSTLPPFLIDFLSIPSKRHNIIMSVGFNILEKDIVKETDAIRFDKLIKSLYRRQMFNYRCHRMISFTIFFIRSIIDFLILSQIVSLKRNH